MGCGQMSQERWLKIIAGEVDGYEGYYRLVGTYKDADGNTALLIQDNDESPYVHAVFTEEGGNKVFYASNPKEGEEALEQGKDFLADMGFILQEGETTLKGEDNTTNTDLMEDVHRDRSAQDKEDAIKTLATALNLPGFGITDEEFAEGTAYADSKDVHVQDLSLNQWKQVGRINEGFLGVALGHVHPDFGEAKPEDLSKAEVYAMALSTTQEERTQIEQALDRARQVRKEIAALLELIETIGDMSQDDENPFGDVVEQADTEMGASLRFDSGLF